MTCGFRSLAFSLRTVNSSNKVVINTTGCAGLAGLAWLGLHPGLGTGLRLGLRLGLGLRLLLGLRLGLRLGLLLGPDLRLRSMGVMRVRAHRVSKNYVHEW